MCFCILGFGRLIEFGLYCVCVCVCANCSSSLLPAWSVDLWAVVEDGTEREEREGGKKKQPVAG